MIAPPPSQLNPPIGDDLMPPQRSPRAEFWRLLRKNRMAFSGLVVFALFFLLAIIGLALTSGTEPLVDPSTVRLQEKLRPPLSRANAASLSPDEVPPLGIYLLGTDDLGRDVFARMLQGAWVSLTVGFVAVGISVIIGVFIAQPSSTIGTLSRKKVSSSSRDAEVWDGARIACGVGSSGLMRRFSGWARW